MVTEVDMESRDGNWDGNASVGVDVDVEEYEGQRGKMIERAKWRKGMKGI